MERRDFIRWGVAGLSATVITPTMVFAKNVNQVPVSDIYYTKESPGRWKDKVAGHLPSIGIEKAGTKITIRVVTSHEMIGYEHYIVKHVLLDQNYKFLDEHLFNPDKDKAAISTFPLDNYSGSIHALSLCNKHDLWLNSANV
ncbi:desulfoferrodoxin family protein [Methyloglobulus sp.]|uniref:desulfoferrodoxin family protein n=1 Tax=Methyloglobulus sp. TaxID=2518622 RepID=UPI003988BFB0